MDSGEWSGRKGFLMQLARAKLREVRTSQRVLSDAHSAAKLQSDRLASELQRWQLLRDECRAAARALEDLASKDAAVQDIVADESLQSSEDIWTLVEAARQESNGVRAARERAHVDAIAEAKAAVDRRNAELDALKEQKAALLRRAAERDHLLQRQSQLNALVSTMEADAAELERQSADLTRQAASHAREENKAITQLQELTMLLSASSLSPSMFPAEENIAAALARATRAQRDGSHRAEQLKARLEDLQSQCKGIDELRLERMRLEDTKKLLHHAQRVLEEKRVITEVQEMRVQQAMLQSQLSSLDVNIEAMQDADRGKPTLEELEQHVLPTLRRQVEDLSSALSVALRGLHLLDGSEGGDLSDRCGDLQRSTEAYERTTKPQYRAAIVEKKQQLHQHKVALEQWAQESERHEFYLVELDAERQRVELQRAQAQREHALLLNELERCRLESEEMESQRMRWALEDAEWEAEFGSDAERRVLSSPSSTMLCDDEDANDSGSEVDAVEIVDGDGRVRIVTVPHPHKPTFLPASIVRDSPAMCGVVTSPRKRGMSGDAAGASAVSNPAAGLERGGRLGKAIAATVGLIPRLLYRGFVDIVRGKPVYVPGGGAALTLKMV